MKEGFFRAGRVPIIMNYHLAAAIPVLKKRNRMGKLIDNYFEMSELVTVNGEYYVPKMIEDTVWIKLTPRRKPLCSLPYDEVVELINVFFSWKSSGINQPTAQLTTRLARRLDFLQQKYK